MVVVFKDVLQAETDDESESGDDDEGDGDDDEGGDDEDEGGDDEQGDGNDDDGGDDEEGDGEDQGTRNGDDTRKGKRRRGHEVEEDGQPKRARKGQGAGKGKEGTSLFPGGPSRSPETQSRVPSHASAIRANSRRSSSRRVGALAYAGAQPSRSRTRLRPVFNTEKGTKTCSTVLSQKSRAGERSTDI